jgi:NAD(P)-dependent dehydrogenase (short-subunit alcohol dehydrogenase family)
MQIKGSTALVTGANRGLGERLVRELLAAGAAKVYAGSRDPGKVTVPGAVPLRLDVTDPESVRAAAALAGDVTLLVNNAGVATGSQLLGDDLADLRAEFETNALGLVHTVRAFAPVLAGNGGGAILNVLSVLSWLTGPGFAGYAASKAAAWSLTNATRLALAGQGTLVTALHVGYMDTDMAAHVDGPKSDPAKVARLALEGVEAGRFEVLADEISEQVRAGLSGGVAALYPDLTAS